MVKKQIMRLQIITITVLLISQTVFAQTGIITVLDKDTKQVISYANVCFEGLKTGTKLYSITSPKGEVKNVSKERSQIAISFVGYKPLIDTINPNQSIIFYIQSDILNLEQVVITATRTEKALKDAPVITQVITSRQIETRGFQTVQDVLEADIPGIEFNRHGSSNDINIQGLEARNVLVLIDGERLAGETRGNVDYSRLNTNDIERIEIVKGASSALYGSQAMGAIINIITKKSRQKFYGNISARYLAFNEMNYPDLRGNDDDYNFKYNLDKPNLNIGGLFGFNLKKFGSKTSFVIKSTDAYQLYDCDSLTKEYIDIDTIIYEPLDKTPAGIEGTKDYSVTQNVNYRFSNKFSIEVDGGYYYHDKYDFNRDNKHDVYEDISYGLKALYQQSDSKSVIFSFHSDTYNKYDFLEKLNKKEKKYRHRYLNPKITGNYTIGEKQVFTGGLEYLDESLLSNMFVFGEIHEKQVSNSVLFLQDDINLNSKLNIIAGIRGEYHTTYGSHFTPKLSVMYKWLPITFRLNYAAGYRSPSLKELYMNWSHHGMFVIRGNENLKPETNNYFSGSVELSKSWIDTSVTIYENLFNNKIQGIWSENQTVYQYQNIEKSSLFGIDYLLKIKLTKSFMFKGAYSYVNNNDYQMGVRLSSISPHTANTQLEYNYTKGIYSLTANITGKYIGSKDFNVLDKIEYSGKTIQALYKMHYDAYSIWKLTVSQRFYNSINLVIGVDNLFDYTAEMITFNTSTSPGRRYFVSLNIEIENFLNNLITK